MTGFAGFNAPTSSSFGMNTQTTASPFGNDYNLHVLNYDIFFLCNHYNSFMISVLPVFI